MAGKLLTYRLSQRAGFAPAFSTDDRMARLGGEVCRSPEDFKAWSQNLAHEQVLTTFLNYGSVAVDRQGAIIRGLGTARASTQPNAQEIADAVAGKLQGTGTNTPVASA
jgi:hypothetical protein